VKGTAYGLDEAATIAGSAVAAGIKPGKELESTLKLVADAATIGKAPLNEMGAVFNKVAAGGRLTAREVNQLGMRGIPVLQFLGKTLGKTTAEVREMVSRGEVDFATFSKAMEDGLGGAALASGNTTMGALRNVKAAMSRFGASLLQGVFPIFKDVFGGAIKLIDGLTEKVGPLAERLGDALGGALKSDEMREFFGSVMDAARESFDVIRGAFETLAQALVDAGLMDVLEEFWGHIQTLGGEVKKTLDHLAAWWAEHGDEVKAVLGPLGDAVKATFEAILGVIRGVMNIIAGIIKTVLALIRGDWSGAWDGIKQIAKGASQVIVAIVKGLGKLAVAALRLAWNLAVAATRAAWNALKGAVSAGVSHVVGFVRSLPGKIRSAIGNLGGLLVDAGRSLIQGLINGITSKLGELWGKVSGIAGRIKSLKGPLDKDAVLLRPAGRAIIGGLMQGIDEQLGPLYRQVSGIAPRLAVVAPGGSLGLPGLPTLAGAGSAGNGPVEVHEHYHVHTPGGTTLVGSAETVARMIAPSVRSASRAADQHRARRR